MYWGLVAPVAAICAAATGLWAVLNMDGGTYFFKLYDRCAPYVAFSRVGAIPQQLPAVAACKAGASYSTVRTVFLVGYAISPALLFAIAAALVWHRREQLLPVLVGGMLGTTAIVQVFFVAESVITVHYWWCAWAAFASTGRSWQRSVAGLVFVALALLTYPPAAALVLLLATTLALREWPSERLLVAVMVALTAARAVVLVADQSERAQGTGSSAYFNPLTFLGKGYLLGAALVIVGGVLATRRPRWALLAAAGAGIVVLAANRSDYGGVERIAIWAVVVPVAALGCLVLLRHAQRQASAVSTSFVAGLLAMWVALVGLGLNGWRNSQHQVESTLAAMPPGGCEIVTSLRWGATSQALVIQGPDAGPSGHKLILWPDTASCRGWKNGEYVITGNFTLRDEGGKGNFELP